MLVVVSDLHLTDGSTGETISAGAFPIFAERLREMAVAASWRTDGSYRPIDQIDVVLLGDVLDVIRSARWLQRPGLRPWSNAHSSEFLEQITQITSDILERNETGLSVLRQISGRGGVSVPPALRVAKPAGGNEAEPVSVRIHYMVGNHDWFFHHPNPAFQSLRELIVRRMGLANAVDRPFPHDMNESEELLVAMRRHKVTARHGDLYDPVNFEGDRDASSLGDAIVVELVNRFGCDVERELGGDLPAATLVGLREIDNVRPLLLVPVWIDGLLERTCSWPALRKRVKLIWDRLVDEFLSLDFVRSHDTYSPFDVVDGLQRALKFSKRLSVNWASSITSWVNSLRGAASDSYSHHALCEQDFRNRRSKHIIYGHTHTAEMVPLDASYAEGYVLNQVYFNSGTWRRIYRQTELAPAEHEFIAADTMNYVAFFQGDERKGRPYESWSGILGFHPGEVTVHRVDAGRSRQASASPLATPAAHHHAPHFATTSAKPRVLPNRRPS